MGPNFVLDKGYQATTAITQFRAVTLVSDTGVKQTDAAAAVALGVCQENVSAADATAGRITDVRIMGITRAINGTGGALARATLVATDNAGRVVAATTGQAAIGLTLTAATAQGDQVDLLLLVGTIKP
jgi:inactivated superfamily I helicase